MENTETTVPLVTVYITNHNYEKFIRQAIESVLCQTMDDYELIIIDDGSSDNSRAIIEEYKTHPKILTVFQQNKGLNVTNNIALRLARGKYIMRLDADDYLDENALTILSGALEREPEVGLVFPDYYMIDTDGSITEIVCRHNFDDVELMDMPAHGACTMLRKECLEGLGGYDESFKCQDGYDLWIRFIGKYEVRNINLPLFYYRQHPKSLTKNECRILGTRGEIIDKWTAKNGDKMEVVGIVPVRGKVANPNSTAMKPLAGKPLLEWTLDAAIKCKKLSKVILTSPDKEIIAHAHSRYGDQIMILERDLEFAEINTHIADTALHAIDEYSKNNPSPDAVAMLYIEAPFRMPEQIDTSIDVMGMFETDCVLGVRPESNTFYQHHGAGMEPVRKSASLRLEREDLYRDAGRMQLVTIDYLRKKRRTVGGLTGHVILDQRAAFNVTTEWEWEMAEYLGEKILKEQEAARD